MGEIIARPIPPIALPFTGERLTSVYGGQTEIEHMHRYLLAREWCRGKDVLDVASGEGYGTALLAQVANSAVGVEIAADAVVHATNAYGSGRLHFVQGDARSIPAEDARFDVVVSFETIEHFAEQEQFVAEVRRVLRPGGLFIVSTPDRDNYSPAETPANPYHVKELTPEEFERLLRSRFASLSLLAQRPVFGSVLMPAGGSGTAAICFERRGNEHFEGSLGLPRPQYIVALASDGTLPSLPPSVFIESGRLGMLSPADYAAQLQALEARRSELQEAAEDDRRRHAEQASAAQSELARLTEIIGDLRAEAALHAADARDTGLQLARARQEAMGLLAANESTEQAVATLRDILDATVRTATATQSAAPHVSIPEGRLKAMEFSSDLRGAEQALLTAQKDRENAELRLQWLLASTSWRMTAPVRAVGRLFKRRP